MTTGENKSPSEENEQQLEEGERPPSTPVDCNIAMRCVLKDDVERFTKCFEDEEDPFFSTVAEQLIERDENGKSPIDMASIIGRTDMLKELITRGVDVNTQTSSGYTAMHHAACWGKVNCLKVLVENSADLQLKTKQGERAREVAERYNQTECVDFLDWAEARQMLLNAITLMRETMADPEKIQGRLSRDDKNLATSVCNEKSDWVENTPDATTADFFTTKQALDEALAPVWAKLSEPRSYSRLDRGPRKTRKESSLIDISEVPRGPSRSVSKVGRSTSRLTRRDERAASVLKKK